METIENHIKLINNIDACMYNIINASKYVPKEKEIQACYLNILNHLQEFCILMKNHTEKLGI